MTSRLTAWLHRAFWAWLPFATDPRTEQDIHVLQSRLDRGPLRLTASPVSLSLAWFPAKLCPEEEDGWAADQGVPSAPPDVREAFFEEVAVLREAIATPDEHIPLATWQRGDDSEIGRAGRQMHRRLNKQAFALNNWDRYAVPLRLVGDRVIRIWSPGDVGGEPIAQSLPADVYVAATARKTALDAARIAQLERQRLVLGIMILIALATIAAMWH